MPDVPRQERDPEREQPEDAPSPPSKPEAGPPAPDHGPDRDAARDAQSPAATPPPPEPFWTEPGHPAGGAPLTGDQPEASPPSPGPDTGTRPPERAPEHNTPGGAPDAAAVPPPPFGWTGPGDSGGSEDVAGEQPASEHPAGAPPFGAQHAGEWGFGPGGPQGETAYGDGTLAAPPIEPIERRSVGRSAGRILREIAETIILALLIFLLVRAVVQNFQVEGSSMQPTLQSRWYLLVNKAVYFEINLETLSKFIPFIEPGDDPTRYLFRAPKRGDVIVFKQPTQAPGQTERDFIKRIIGVPGDTVEVRGCTGIINGQPLDEPYAQITQPNAGICSFGPETVPEGHYFVMGDNRNNSSDSRGNLGMVPKDNIIGKAWFTYWPFSEIGFIGGTPSEPGSDAPPQPAGGDDPAKEPAGVVPNAAGP